MYCKNCGMAIRNRQSCCPFCGHKITTKVVSTSARDNIPIRQKQTNKGPVIIVVSISLLLVVLFIIMLIAVLSGNDNYNVDAKSEALTDEAGESQSELEEITPEDIAQAINTASTFAWNWFWNNQHTDTTDIIEAAYGGSSDPWNYERVTEEGITTIEDVKSLTMQYFTADIADEIVGYKEWIEQDGALYVSATEGLGCLFPDYYEIYVNQISDTEYKIILYTYYYGMPEETKQEEITYSHINGYWVFDTVLTHYDELPIYVLTEPNDELLPTHSAWKNAYIKYIQELEKNNTDVSWDRHSYSLIYVDDNDIPELYVEGIYEAEGDRICTIGENDSVIECRLNRIGGASYIERSGMICNFNGNMGYYPLDFYKLEDGRFIEMENASGLKEINWDYEGNDVSVYSWNGITVSKEEFDTKWNSIMNQDDLLSPSDTTYDAIDIFAMIQILPIL